MKKYLIIKIMIISRIKGEKGFVDIYNKSNGNFELINNIKGLISENEDRINYSVFLCNLEILFSDYEKVGKQMLNIKKYMLIKWQKEWKNKYFKKEIDDLIQNKIKMENNNIDNLNKNFNNLRNKVNFFWPIILSIISRKEINHCIWKITDTYKDSFSIKNIINEKRGTLYKIEFKRDKETRY